MGKMVKIVDEMRIDEMGIDGNGIRRNGNRRNVNQYSGLMIHCPKNGTSTLLTADASIHCSESGKQRRS